MGKGKIYMLPTPIGDTPVWDVLPQYNRTVIDRLEYFIVERCKGSAHPLRSKFLILNETGFLFSYLHYFPNARFE